MTTTPHPLPGQTAKGIAFLVAGVAVFSVQDLILKLLSGAYPLHQAMLLRSLTAIPFLLFLVHWEGGLRSLVTPGTRAMILRGLVMFAAYTCYYLALAALPMATTVALYFSAPLFITILSVVFLSETVGPRRWIALMAGFAGLLIMVRPGGALFDWAALLPVLSGLTYAISMIAARRLGTSETASALAFWGNAVFLMGAILLSLIFGSGAWEGDAHPSLAFLLRGWVMPTALDLALMMACGIIAAAGLTLLTQAYRVAEASVVTPFEYTGLIWSVLFGWLFWRDWPDGTDWAGIAIITGAGLYILWREARRSA
ncbi:DMT family transporter [Paragemmobacter ruber]|uniref:EamA family transporter n=1 Tax=Paragemmobacter ruber TaxID=1985673 RepID=A0ABW9Y800_9RHOB|nr:DMT family transporter [Rhodobacter ruber]NBE08706.1 EamA family transporter [Rhodobacter ruber]